MNFLYASTCSFVAQPTVDCFSKCAILSHVWDKELGVPKETKYADYLSAIGKQALGSRAHDEKALAELKRYKEQLHKDEGVQGAILEEQAAMRQTMQNPDSVKDKAVRKIAYTCKRAREAGLEYVWIDTCCIDKSNAQDEATAINSMFEWYSLTPMCFVYMADVPPHEADKLATSRSPTAEPFPTIEPSGQTIETFEKSEWFTRGWTLQELLASKTLRFFNTNWHYFGDESSLARPLTQASGIAPDYLRGGFDSACVAVRMSWLAKRITSRSEDMAYCALGMFGVSMFIKYGEGGEKAFQRLQEELVKSSDDESLFAWTWTERDEGVKLTEKKKSHGLLAPWPTCFTACGTLTIDSKKKQARVRYMADKKGVAFNIPCGLPDRKRRGLE